jgi:predicted nucleotide-binding protein
MNSADMVMLAPNPDDLLARTVEEQRRLLLELLAKEHNSPNNPVARSNFFNRASDSMNPRKYGARQRQVDEALMEAWSWLESRGLLTKKPTSSGTWVYVGKAGKEFVDGSGHADAARRSSGALPPLRHQYIEHEILRLVLQHSDHLGYPTSLPGLESVLRPKLPNIQDRELVDALKRLSPKYITLCKYVNGQPPCRKYPDEISSDDEFFYRGDMRLRRTPHTDPHLQELAARGVDMYDERQSARIERWEELGPDRVRADLIATGGIREVGGGPGVADAAWEWLRMKESQETGATTNRPNERAELSQRVFIVHGHDEGAREAVARFLERVGLEPVILHEQANRGRTIIEKFEAHRDVGFAVVLLTPDDEGCERGGTPHPRARQNVVLELGYFVGVLGRQKVCALRRGDVEIPSDFTGVVYVPFDETDGWKQALGRELEAAGFRIDWRKAMGAN